MKDDGGGRNTKITEYKCPRIEDRLDTGNERAK